MKRQRLTHNDSQTALRSFMSSKKPDNQIRPLNGRRWNRDATGTDERRTRERFKGPSAAHVTAVGATDRPSW